MYYWGKGGGGEGVGGGGGACLTPIPQHRTSSNVHDHPLEFQVTFITLTLHA